MKKQMLKSALIALAGVGLMSGVALADSINGTISLTGNLQLTGGSSFTTSTGINFLDDDSMDDLNIAKISGGTGDFSSFAGGYANMTDFTFIPFSPVNNLWTIAINTGYHFDLTTLTPSFYVVPAGSTPLNFLTLTGSGVLHATGHNDTYGTWSLTTQEPGSDLQFSWSSGTSAVPEPATMLLFGTGLVGLAGVTRRKIA